MCISYAEADRLDPDIENQTLNVMRINEWYASLCFTILL